MLKGVIQTAGLRVVSLDLPTSHTALTANASDDLTGKMLDTVNAMLLVMLAAVARKDYKDRRRRQAEGTSPRRRNRAAIRAVQWTTRSIDALWS